MTSGAASGAGALPHGKTITVSNSNVNNKAGAGAGAAKAGCCKTG